MNDIAADPFREHATRLSRVLPVLGCRVRFESNSRQLLLAAANAFAGLPSPGRNGKPLLRVALVLVEGTGAAGGRPPALKLTSGAGLLAGVSKGFASVVVDVAGRRALAVITRDMLKFSYHLRYEVIELLALTLAARVRELVPLHAACVARGDRAVLLLGDSGAGKSTLSLLAMAAGMQVVAEDSAFVARGLRVLSAPGRLHVGASSLRLLSDPVLRKRIRRAPVIRRRSGARKHALDLRQIPGALARRAPRLVAVLQLKSDREAGVPRLRAIAGASLRRTLRGTQPYAARQQSWPEFERALHAIPAWSLARGSKPRHSVAALESLLNGKRT